MRLVILAAFLMLGSFPAIARAPSQHPCRGATIAGTRFADFLVGTPGRDVIRGGAGHDVIFSLDGNDILCGGKGKDRLFGGGGNDAGYGGRAGAVCTSIERRYGCG